MLNKIFPALIAFILWQQVTAEGIKLTQYMGPGKGGHRPEPTKPPARPRSYDVCNEDYTISYTRGRVYKYYDTAVNYSTAAATCEEDGAHLMMLRDKVEENDVAYIRDELDLARDLEIHIGLQQTTLYTYTYVDGRTMTLNADSGLPTGGEYQRFYSETNMDFNDHVLDSLTCVKQEGVAYIYSWLEHPCSADLTYICLCY